MNFIRKIAFYSALLLFSLIVSEIFLRIAKPRSLQYYRDVKLVHKYHPDYGVTLAPNHKTYIRHHTGLWEGKFATNSLGQRGTKEINADSLKIVCLGDSLVMGFGVSDEDTFCALLDGVEIKGKKRQAVNLGVDAYGSLGFYKRLKDQIKYLPNTKEVLLFISPNDFAMPEALLKQGILPDDELDSLHENDEVWKKSFYLQFEATRYSYLLQALKLAWEQNKIAYLSLKAKFKESNLDLKNFSLTTELKSAFLNPRNPCEAKVQKTKNFFCPEPVPVERFQCQQSRPPLGSELPVLPAVTQKAYLDMIQLSKKYGFKLIPVFVPSQVEEIYCELNNMYHPLGDYAIRAISFFQNQEISVIRLMPYAKTMCNTKSPTSSLKGIEDHFLPGDGHLTKLGNAWVYESLKSELEKLP